MASVNLARSVSVVSGWVSVMAAIDAYGDGSSLEVGLSRSSLGIAAKPEPAAILHVSSKAFCVCPDWSV